MAAKRGKRRSATRKVTLSLDGWPAETRKLTVVEACWYVELTFEAEGKPGSKVVRYFTSDDYDKALAMYELLLPVVKD